MKLNYLFSLLILCFSGISFSQKGELNSYRNLVGDEITWTLSVALIDTSSLQYIPIIRGIEVKRIENKDKHLSNTEEIEIIGAFQSKFVKEVKGYTWEGIYKCMVWDSGRFELPIQVVMADGKQYELKTAPYFTNNIPQEKGLEIYDIQERYIVEDAVKIPWYKKWQVYVLASCLCAIAFAGWWFFIRKKPKRNSESIVAKSTLVKTLEALVELQKSDIWKKDMKEHFVQKSEILNRFLTELYRARFEEMTTNQTIGVLKQKDVSVENLSEITRILDHADMVKFAQSDAPELIIYSGMEKAKTLVQQLFDQHKN